MAATMAATITWVCVFVLALVIEAISVQLVSVWFALGALAAFVLSFFAPDNYTLQIIVFLGVSIVTLLVTRPLIRKKLKPKIQRTNADKIVGMTAIVVDEIVNEEGRGTVKVEGVVWNARNETNTVCAPGEMVTVAGIDGNKLIVR